MKSTRWIYCVHKMQCRENTVWLLIHGMPARPLSGYYWLDGWYFHETLTPIRSYTYSRPRSIAARNVHPSFEIKVGKENDYRDWCIWPPDERVDFEGNSGQIIHRRVDGGMNDCAVENCRINPSGFGINQWCKNVKAGWGDNDGQGSKHSKYRTGTKFQHVIINHRRLESALQTKKQEIGRYAEPGVAEQDNEVSLDQLLNPGQNKCRWNIPGQIQSSAHGSGLKVARACGYLWFSSVNSFGLAVSCAMKKQAKTPENTSVAEMKSVSSPQYSRLNRVEPTMDFNITL